MAVGDITFEYLKMLDDMYEIEESKILYWTQWLTHLLKLHIEPTSAMTMEAVAQWLKNQKTKKRVMIILSAESDSITDLIKLRSESFISRLSFRTISTTS